MHETHIAKLGDVTLEKATLYVRIFYEEATKDSLDVASSTFVSGIEY